MNPELGHDYWRLPSFREVAPLYTDNFQNPANDHTIFSATVHIRA